MRARSFGTLLVLAAAIGLAGSARATPIFYGFASGTVHLKATLNTASNVVLDTTINLNGNQVTFDSTPPWALTSFLFTTGAVGPLALTGSLAGEFLSVSSLSVKPDATYGNIVPISNPSPNTYNYTVGKIDFAANGVVGTGLSNFGPVNLSQVNPSLSGSVQTNIGQISLNGITLGPFSLPGVPGNLTLKADVTFFGLVPEPGTALLLGSGLLALAAARRRAES